ncbi:MAG: bifunctional phosphopantothenoylcysteine decarboxylase/phosphopantothenate--cysteine ligase CoaBC [Bacteriovoracia bacterium]
MNPFLRDNLTPYFSGKRILLGVSGSIAAFKAVDLVRGLKDCGAEVKVVLTASAEKFVTTTTLETLSGEKVLRGFWQADGELAGDGTHHIATARWADLILVAPASANTIARLAHGMADDLLATEVLASRAPLFLAPAMNPAMFEHVAVQANLRTLRERGAEILGPAAGDMACGETGTGRMLEPDAVLAEMAVRSARLATRGGPRPRLLVTLGPTRSYLDPVRFLTNRSSGKMGVALAWQAALHGMDVEAVSGPVSSELSFPPGASVTWVTTTSEMADAVRERFPSADVFISTAAVLDWEFDGASPTKIKKTGKDGVPAPHLRATPDILAEVAQRKRPHQFVLGFAAETDRHLENAKLKLAAKGCDAIFVNDVSRAGAGFESDANEGWWLSRVEVEKISSMPKARVAEKLVHRIESLRRHRAQVGPEAHA